MNLVLPNIVNRFRTPRQIISHAWSERDMVLKKNVNLFCWKRPNQPAITDYLTSVLEKEVVPIKIMISTDDLKDQINELRAKWNAQNDPAADSFWVDVYVLAFDFLSLARCMQGTLHLKVIEDNACTKFHMDGYVLRLFTTYLGQGTEWLPEKATNRRGLGKTNDLIVKDASQIRQMGAFEVGILKGEIHNQKNETRGIVHRSPEIASKGEKRIIMRIDI